MTTLYPNAAAPAHGVFVENRLRVAAAEAGAEVKVIAPTPWFPVKAPQAGRYAAFAAAPSVETRHGIEVRHPRYLLPPKIGMTYAAHALERCFMTAARALLAEGWDFDLVDAHYLYPDGIAAVRAARRLGKPVVVTARGTDVNLLPRYARQRAMILEAVRKADAVVCVAKALKDELVGLGAPAEKIEVLRNGVDLRMFSPRDRERARAELGISGVVLASVGLLTERKGHHLVIDAVKDIPGATLLVVGAGEERARLERRARANGMADRVRFLGAAPHEMLANIYSAADLLVLASSREGWPNVLLESMACGTPCVATPVWGSGEVVSAPEAGRLARERSAQAIADVIRATLASPPDRAATRRHAERHGWEETAQSTARIFTRLASRHAGLRTEPLPAACDRPLLIVTVDTEERFDWRSFPPQAWHAGDPDGVARFQEAASDAGVKPLYFLTSSMIEDAPTAGYFRNLAAVHAADLGLHLHQWRTAPNETHLAEYFSWQCNLPPSLHLAKLRTLGAQFEVRFGARARAHRAGRYGVSLESYREIAAAGIDLDFSPSPAFDFSRRGGPDFSSMANAPFRVRTPEGEVFVTPVCGARSIRGTRLFLPQARNAPGLPTSAIAPPPFTAPARLTCEGIDLAELKAMTARLHADGVRIFTFSLHSTSMSAGASPYAGSETDVARMLETTRRYFDWFVRKFGGAFVPLDELAVLYGASKPALNLNPALSADA